MLRLHKIFREPHPKRERNDKNRVRSSAATVLPYLGSYFKGDNARLSIYGIRDVPAFVKKGDTPAFR
jgi:hypothetical protein